METIVLNSNSKENMRLIADLARKIGVSVKYLTDEEKEDRGMVNAIKKGRTGEFVNTEDYLQKIGK
jgi:hypothetical protein